VEDFIMDRRRIEISVGDKYGTLTIVLELPPKARASGGTSRMVLCRCECGKEISVELKNLRSGHTSSCGCTRKSTPPIRSELSPGSLEKMRLSYLNRADYHGMKDTSEYVIWMGMKERCSNPRARGYANYGGRGIVVCGGWKSSFKTFFKDIGARPSLEHSIDRIDGNGNYSCGHCEECVARSWTANCRWATRAEQRRNAKNIRMLTFQGETMCMADWAKRKGMSKAALSSRLDRMSVDEALRKPVRQWRGDNKFHQIPESERNAEWRRDAERRAARSRRK
jgi:hypothetical protein